MTILKCASFGLFFAALVPGCARADAEPSAMASASTTALEAQKPRVPSDKPTASLSPEAAISAAPDGGTAPNAQGAATLEFQNRIKNYLRIHNEGESKVPNLKNTDDPRQISDREMALAKAIQTLRAGAQIGEIFAPEYQPYFIKIVQDDFATRSAVDRKAIINELPKNMKVDVNTVYPTALPLATFPAVLLRKLPDLPPELEYRLVGRSLILRDVKANLIVDILRDVVPTIPS
ncbi:MAG: hypothetical protein WC815_19515 [Vicinamibacterales bacterium]|jgi:hypothetical protein